MVDSKGITLFEGISPSASEKINGDTQSGEFGMLDKHDDFDLDKNRLTLTDLRKIKKYSNVSDEEGEAIIDDTITLTRMILEILY